jgi:nitrite reductase/ring-hydroxylating ferredoxin subunit
MLVRNPDGIELLSNVCRHRQAIMLNGRGNARNIVCPLHRWTYDLKGGLLGAPHFEQPCLHLNRSPLQNWNGLLFEGKRDVRADLAKLGVAQDLTSTATCSTTSKSTSATTTGRPSSRSIWRTTTSCRSTRAWAALSPATTSWEFGDWHSVQTVGLHAA